MSQGYTQSTEMNAMLITHKYKILRNKKPTYKRLVCDIRLQKTDFYKQF